MARQVMLTGGSGFVGSAILKELLEADWQVNALVKDKPLGVQSAQVRQISGGLFDKASLDAAMKDCTAVIHVVGVIREKGNATFERIHVEGTRNVIEAAKRAGVRRYVQMSALGVHAEATSGYQRTKYEADQLVQASGLEWTIFRPSLIHGPEGEFMKNEAAWARGKALPYFFMPYFGSGFLGWAGAGRLQPVYVRDVARAFAESLANPLAVGQIYDLGGPDVLTWPELHHACARTILGHTRLAMPIPAWYALLVARLLPGAMLPFNKSQVLMSQEDNTCDMTKFKTDFGWQAQPFLPTLGGYASEL